MTTIDAIGRGIAEGWWMFFDTFWALVLGFGLSGAVQAFVSRAEMQRSLGDHQPKALARASFFGVVSSSCSYAASALAKSLFVRGADFTAAMVFMVASTNLVVELGIVLWLLLGWQFALAEFVGGAIMIVLLGLVLPRVIPPAWIAQARDQLGRGSDHGGAHEHHGEQDGELVTRPWRQRIRSRAGWSEASGFTISDLTMIRKEMAAGFLIAGFAAAVVPTWFWRAIFLTGHGFWSSLENVVLGPFVAIISFVCSIGNVPLAAALWKGGISFGGVVSFVFADLITIPLLLIYRKYFGTRLMVRLLAAFWAVMSTAGLVTEYLFKFAHIVPANQLRLTSTARIGVNYTTVLNIIAALVFSCIYAAYRRSRRNMDEDAAPYAKDVVCGMQVEKAHAPARTTHNGKTFYFCSDRCQNRFSADPAAFVSGVESPDAALADAADTEPVIDPVCGIVVPGADSASRFEYSGRDYLFCSDGCRDLFARDPIAHLVVAGDPVCGMDVTVAGATAEARHEDVRYVFCGLRCRDTFVTDPQTYLSGNTPGAERERTIGMTQRRAGH